MPNETCETTVRVAALCGSIRPGSYTRMALEIALRGVAGAGFETDLIDLRDFRLVFADGGGDEGHAAPDVVRLRERIKAADGIILGTPEYHGSFSGVLKNALDLTGFGEWEGKMLGLVGVSGGRMGAYEALNSLRHTLALQPKNFVALAELGEILEEYNDKPHALDAYRQAKAIDPFIDGLTDRIRDLTKTVEGQGI